MASAVVSICWTRLFLKGHFAHSQQSAILGYVEVVEFLITFSTYYVVIMPKYLAIMLKLDTGAIMLKIMPA